MPFGPVGFDSLTGGGALTGGSSSASTGDQSFGGVSLGNFMGGTTDMRAGAGLSLEHMVLIGVAAVAIVALLRKRG